MKHLVKGALVVALMTSVVGVAPAQVDKSFFNGKTVTYVAVMIEFRFDRVRYCVVRHPNKCAKVYTVQHVLLADPTTNGNTSAAWRCARVEV